MRPAARVQAAIAVVHEMQLHHRPASAALADWGKSNRYAGSGDRAAIGNLVYDALRRRASAEHLMEAHTARAGVLGALRTAQGLEPDAIAALCDGGMHTPKALSPFEKTCLKKPLDRALPGHVAAEVPEWAMPHFAALFGDRAAAEGQALAERAPVDIRVNAVKIDRSGVLEALARHNPSLTQRSALGLRIPLPEGSNRHPNLEAEITHGHGWFEVQDEGSQIAAALTGVKPGQTVLDLCAGAGGKTLAMAAAMANKGVVFAYDDDKFRLRPIIERIARAGVTNIEPVTAGDKTALAALGPRFDCVLVDAPCSGSGTWRRKPDAKWRLKADSLVKRQKEQRDVLAVAARHVCPGGRLVYVTCSLFADENTAQVEAFLAANPGFRLLPTAEAWATASPGALAGAAPASADGRTDTLLLSPASHGTDGFFVAVMART
jgi:16S rRNA (cytosine967-C5)-methyltransferase